MLAPHYKDGMGWVYSDLARATIGTELVAEMNKSAYRTLANPLDEEDVIAVALQDYQAEEQRPNRELVQKMTRGCSHRFFGNTHVWHQRGCARHIPEGG